MEKIFLVYGSTGEYSDHIEWYIKAFASKEKAENHVLLADRKCKELIIKYKYDSWLIPAGANEFDPMMRVDYTGTNYYCVEVPFEE